MSAMFRKSGEELSRMVEVPYEAEHILQELLANHPGLLAGDSADSEAHWLLVQREIGIAEVEDGGSRWSLDHLFVDREAVPTLVEVKRSTDTRIRREVVGQMLDYAANGSAVWNQESIRASFESSRESKGKDPHMELQQFLGEADPDEFWNRVGENLRLGKLRLVFVADEIPGELRRVIEFLNEQMESTEVIGIEVKQFGGEGEDAAMLMSTIVGRTESSKRAKGTSSPSKQTWTVDEFKTGLRKRHESEVAARAIQLHELLLEAGASLYAGGGSSEPSMNYWLSGNSPTSVSLSMYMGSIAVNFEWVDRYRPDDEMERLLALAEKIPGSEKYLAKPRAGVWNVRPGMRYEDILRDDDAPSLIVALIVEASTPVSQSLD